MNPNPLPDPALLTDDEIYAAACQLQRLASLTAESIEPIAVVDMPSLSLPQQWVVLALHGMYAELVAENTRRIDGGGARLVAELEAWLDES